MTGHLASALVRRGAQMAQEHFTKKAYVEKLEQDAQLYEDAGPEGEVKLSELLPVAITAIVAILIIWSIDYTIGQVMSSLAMIESPSRTAIIESKPPAYADVEPDAPLEKEPLLLDADTDVEVTVIDHKPITAKITTTIGHLQRVGGWTARWRGLGLAVAYHVLHGVFANFLAAFLGAGIIGEVICSVIASVGLLRLHLAWTHKMISHPSEKSWYSRLPGRKQCRALLLPTLVYAVAQQATIILPVAVAFVLGVAKPHGGQFKDAMNHEDCSKIVRMGLGIIAVPATYIFVGLAVLLPASVTLTRIEAALLPEGEEAIVPFDKAAIMGDVDLSVRGGCRALFVQAWRSFDKASRWRLIKLYAKMILAQFTVGFVALHLMIAELYVIGGERIAIFIKSAAAQLQLAAIEAHENN